MSRLYRWTGNILACGILFVFLAGIILDKRPNPISPDFCFPGGLGLGEIQRFGEVMSFGLTTAYPFIMLAEALDHAQLDTGVRRLPKTIPASSSATIPNAIEIGEFETGDSVQRDNVAGQTSVPRGRVDAERLEEDGDSLGGSIQDQSNDRPRVRNSYF